MPILFPGSNTVTNLMTRRRAVLAAVAVLAVGFGPISGADPINSNSYTKAIEADIAHLATLADQFKEDTGNRTLPSRVKATAMLIASHAQANMSGDQADRMAAIRAGALKVAEGVAAKNADAWQAAVAALKQVQADPAADKSPLQLATMHKTELYDVMNLFSRPRGGGMNIENDIRAMRKDGVKDTALAELVGVRTAAIADYAIALPPAFSGKKTKEDWDRLSLEMKTLAADFALEAAKGDKADAAKLKKTATALDANCLNCHKVFRDD